MGDHSTDGRVRWPDRLLATEELPIVGRAAELAELTDGWAHVLAGRRRVELVGGEPGAGKSRLAATVAQRCRDDGAAVVLGTSFAELGVPFQPFAEILSQLLTEPGGVADDLPADCLDTLARIVDDLADRRRHDHARTDGDGADDGRQPLLRSSDAPGRYEVDDRRQLFDAVVAALRAAAHRWPLVVILEDLHWAGRPSLQLLTHLARTTTTERLLVIGTHRTTAPDHTDDLSRSLAELDRIDGVGRVELHGLDADAVIEFLVDRGVERASTMAAAAALVRQTGGNPFLLRELWRHLELHGGVELLLATDASDLAVPRSIGDSLGLRMSALPAEHVAVLELAAVIGDHGDAATLVAAGDAHLDTALAAIGDGVDAGILRLGGPGVMSYAFVHDLARQVLLDRLAPAARARLHARVAAAMEVSPRPIDRRSSRLAHHWSHAGLYDTDARAVHWLVEAGRDAERSLAFEEAATHLERAALALPDHDERRTELILAAALNAMRSGAFSEGRRLYEQLSEHPDPEIAARAAIGYEDSCWRPGLPGDRAVELLARAARLLDRGHPLHVRVVAALGRALSFVGQNDQADTIGETAIELARETGDDELLAAALQASLWNRVGDPARIGPHLSRSREVAELAERNSDWELLGQAATYRGASAYMVGRRHEWHEARQQLELARRRSGQPFYAYMAGCSDWAEAFLLGDLARARRLAEELVDLGSAFGQDDTEGVYGLQSFMIRRAAGELDQVRPLITGREPLDQGFWTPGLLALYTAFGFDDAARRLVEHLLASELEHDRLMSQSATIVFLTEAVFELRDTEAARRLLPYLEPYAGTNLSAGHFVAVFGSADRYLGLLHQVLGSPRAIEHFRAARELDELTGAPVHVAETLARTADLLDETGDAPAAARQRHEAHVIAEHLGLAGVVEQTRSRAAPPPEPELPDGLTAREVEVLRCIARGASNREIAGELFIAENTVANHVRSIMQKTGSANRTQAAVYAADHSLTSSAPGG